MTHLWRLCLVTFCFQTVTDGFGINLIKVPEDDNTEIGCTLALLQKYFRSGENLSGSVLHMTITSAPAHLQASLMQALHTDTSYAWTLVIKNAAQSHNHYNNDEANAQHVLHEKPQCYFVIIENLEYDNMEEIYEYWKTDLNWNPLAQFVVYFSSVLETDDEMTDIMIEILLIFMSRKIYNVNVIGQSEENSFYSCKTVFPYQPENNCGNRAISIEVLDICYSPETEKRMPGQEVVVGEIGEEEEAKNNTSGKEIYIHSKEKEGQIVENDKHSQEFLLFSRQQQLQDIVENYYTTTSLDIPSTLPNLNSSSFAAENLTLNLGSTHSKIHIQELRGALFLDKFPKDLSGCPLVAAFRPWEPYIFNEPLENNLATLPATEVEENNENSFNFTYGEDMQIDEDLFNYSKQQDTRETVLAINLNGIEYKLIQTIAERLHISVEMQVENENLYYLVQQLIDGDIEMVVGGIDEDPSISQFVSSTIPYHQDDLTWCVAKAPDTRNLFNFLATFHYDVWLLTLLFMATASWSISTAKRYFKIPHFRSNIYVLAIILGQAIHLRPIPTSLKFCFGTLFVMGFMFGNIYQSFLISTLTTPKSYQISHLSEIYQNRMHIRGSVEHVRHLNKEGEIYRYVREQFQMCYNIEECLKLAAKDSKLAVVVSRQHFYYNPRIPRHNLYCFDRNENIYIYFVTILMPKKFHLLHKINPVIQHIIESGHMQKWARDLDRRHKINEGRRRAREALFESLTLTQVSGSFVFNCFLLALALWTFVMECTVYWLVVQHGTRLKLAKYIHKKF